MRCNHCTSDAYRRPPLNLLTRHTQMLADLDMLPSFVGNMHSKFNSPVVAIGIIMSITSFFAFFFNW